MAKLQFPLGVVKERPACCRVVCFCGLFWAFFLGFWVLFLFSVSCCGLAFGVSCVYFLCTKGCLYAFLINHFLPIKKRGIALIFISLYVMTLFKARMENHGGNSSYVMKFFMHLKC